MRTLLVLLLLTNCSSGSVVAETPGGGEQAQTTCPPTLQTTNGTKCARSKMECDIPITCDAVNEQVTCTCESERFVCSDRLGVIPPGEDAVCTPRSSPDDSPCPASLWIANGIPCETTGKLCAYKGPICPESQTGMPALESCVCRGDSGGGKRYVCYPVKCLGF